MMQPVEYFIETRGDACEICGQQNKYANWYERHHVIMRRSKRHPEYDHEINIELLCHSCHASGIADTFEHRQEFAMRQINRGFDVVGWIESLDLRAPEAWLLNL
jgi:hypothetical protein